MNHYLAKLFIGIGVLGSTLFGVASIHLFTDQSFYPTTENTELVHGRLREAIQIDPKVAGKGLEIWLQGAAIPYRGSSGYPKYYRAVLLDTFVPGAEVEVTINPAEKVKPRRDLVRGQDFINLYSLSVNGKQVFTHQDYIAWSHQNTQKGKIVAPVLLGCGLLIIGFGLYIIKR
ncbi:hypothetical protein [Neosynechococcus sphagnicola]|nr:hypothetical protein [Neosynechococcus sphagnicola]